MSYRLYSTIYILIYFSLSTEAKVVDNKAINELPNDESNSIETDSITRYPFMVSIQRNDGGKYSHLCGGSILSNRFVLTAAHCTLKPRELFAKDLSVTGGSPTLFAKSAKRFRVKAMKKHPNFIPLKGNDILILQVEPEIPIDNVRFGTINFRNTTRTREGLNSLLLGWGRTHDNEPKNLEEIPVHTIEDKVCFLDYRFRLLTNSEICGITSMGPRGACDGDSGGPLVDESHQSLYGLLSYGRKACEVGKPYAYTRINVYVNWIEKQMANMLKLRTKIIK